MAKRVIDKRFESEAEEAEWWYENREMISSDFAEAVKAGEAKILTKDRLDEHVAASKAKVVSIPVVESDLELAQQQAARKGLPYQTYLGSLLHEALERENEKLAKSDSR